MAKKYGPTIRAWLEAQPGKKATARLSRVRDIAETDGADPLDDMVIAVIDDKRVAHKDLVQARTPEEKEKLMKVRAEVDSVVYTVTLELSEDDDDPIVTLESVK